LTDFRGSDKILTGKNKQNEEQNLTAGGNGMGYQEIAKRVLGMLQHADGNDPSDGHLTMDNWEWPTGVALYGIYKTYQQSGDRSILDYLTGWYDDMIHREKQPHRNVNTVAPVLTLTCLYDETKNPEYLPVIESWIDWVMKEMPRTEYEGLQHCTVWNKHYQQLWCDTLFMVGLFLAKAGVVLNRPELIEESEYQFLIHIRYLQDKVTGLFYHGWTFDRRHNFANAFWARGNAWFTAAAIELYDITKRDNAAMRMIRNAWKDQVLALWKYQRVNGLYNTLVNVEECYCETSATAAIAYGVLKGIRLGWIPQEPYAETGMLAKDAVLAQIDETGAVQGVSGGTGMGHNLEHYKNIIVTPTAYGQGLTFLMLTELMIQDATPN
jgi:unsaturated rhamnogalacturonyl hydrolase